MSHEELNQHPEQENQALTPLNVTHSEDPTISDSGDPANQEQDVAPLSDPSTDTSIEVHDEVASEKKTEESSADQIDELESLASDHEEQMDAQDDEHVEIDALDKQETTNKLKEIIRNQDVKRFRVVQKLKVHYDSLLKTEEEEAKRRFLEEGNNPDDFEYKQGQDVANLNNLISVYLKSVRQKFQDEEENRRANLIKKNALLANLRDLCDEAESPDSFQKLKEIQSHWKSVGPVPNKDSSEVNRSYSALLDIFYNNRKLYIELIELDRKRNLEQKEHLIERVEKLAEQPFHNKLLAELNSIHEEFRSIGPVSKEHQESIWEKFKTASDKVYESRKQHLNELQSQWELNFQAKNQILQELIKISTETKAENVKAWQALTDEVQKLSEQWKKAGRVPNERISEVNKPFWNAYKQFFQNKSAFFKELDKTRQLHVAAKLKLIEQAEALFNDDWEKNIDQIKTLQLEWKNTGTVSKVQQEKLFARFKAACDKFFSKKREHFKAREEDEIKNLQLKESLCEELEQVDANREDVKAYLSDVRSKWSEIGFVPLKDKEKVSKRYKKAIDHIIESSPAFKGEDGELRKFEMELANMNDNAEAAKLIQQKEFTIRKRISQMESEKQNIENNMMMFGKSNKANALLQQYEHEVERYKKQIDKAKDQLKKIKALGSQK